MALDPAAKSKFEVLFIYPHIKALYHYRIAHHFWVRGHHLLARWISNRARHKTGIEIHPALKSAKG